MILTDKKLNRYFRKKVKSAWQSENVSKITFREGKQVVLQGDTADGVYLITQGIAKCFITEPNGREYILELLGEGELIGELELLTQEKYLCTIQAMSDLTTVKIEALLFQEIVETGGELTELIMKQMAERLRRTSGRSAYQQIYPIRYAILKFLSSVSSEVVRIPKKDLANYLGIPVRSLNRNLRALTEEGIIRLRGSKIVVQSKEKLSSQIKDYHQ